MAVCVKCGQETNTDLEFCDKCRQEMLDRMLTLELIVMDGNDE